MKNTATGSFEVKMKPLDAYNKTEGAKVGRMSIDKRFTGDLDAVSVGEMLSAITAVEGSAGYVAIETVSGSLHGRNGTFVLQHHATMTRGKPQMEVVVVPDSGTGELQGLEGRLEIIVADGKHGYRFDYALTPASR
jgi:hypothetical protein